MVLKKYFKESEELSNQESDGGDIEQIFFGK